MMKSSTLNVAVVAQCAVSPRVRRRLVSSVAVVRREENKHHGFRSGSVR